MPRFAKYEENEEPIAGYKLVDFLGAGQFGEVWKAVDNESGIFTAIKIIDLSHSSSALKELKALNLVRNLRHPNLVPIFTARLKDRNGKEHPLHKAEEVKQKGQLRELIIAMGLGDHSLSARLKQLNPDGTDPTDFKGIPVEELIPYMEGAARGIDYLNRKDHGLPKGTGDGPIIHCDIKPDNMMIVAGEVQIADCGVAVIITPDARQTKAAGSPAYSAPELTGNKPVPGTDQYALAISYYELRTGKLPFDESMGQLSIMLAHAEGRLDFASPVLTEYEIRVLKWATGVQPKSRYSSCMDMVKQLSRAQYDLPPLAPDQIGVKSGVVSVPLDRSKTSTTTKKIVDKSAPPKKDKEKEKPPTDELRGTVIPDSDRMLPPSQAGFTLPQDTGKGSGSKADTKPNNPRGTLMPDSSPDHGASPYASSQSEIVLPAGEGGFTSDADFDPDAPTSPPAPLSASAGTSPADMASLIIERPQISIDRDDPLGAQHGTIELDDEIKKILRQATPVQTPAARTTSKPPTVTTRPASNPIIVPPVSPGKRSTQYPRETPPAEAEEDDQKSLPAWAQEAEKARSQTHEVPAATASTTSTNWKEATPPAKAGGGLPAKLLIGGLLVGGLGAGAFFALKGGGGPAPSGKSSDDKQVEPALVKMVQDQIDAKDWDAAERNLNALPNDDVYKDVRATLKKAIDDGRGKDGTPKIDPVLIDAIQKLIDKGDVKSLDDAEILRVALPSGKEYDPERLRFKISIDDAKSRAANKTKATIISLIAAKDPKSLDQAEALVPQLPPSMSTEANGFVKQIENGRTGNRNRELMEALDALDKTPAARFAAAAAAVQEKIKPEQKDQQKLFIQQVINSGTKDTTLRPSIIDLLTKDKKFPERVTDAEDRQSVFKWKLADLDVPFEKAQKGIQDLAASDEPSSPVVDAAKSGITDLKSAISRLAAPFGPDVWTPKVIPSDVQDFLAVSEVWLSARNRPQQELRTLGEYFKPPKSATPPKLVVPFAMEYLRLGARNSTPLAELRAVRELSKKWSNVPADQLKRIDNLFQNALAFHVQESLRAVPPNWAAIQTTADTDHAHGWAALAKAEQKLTENATGADVLALIADAEKHAGTKDPTAVDRAAYAKYLRSVATRDPKTADALAELFQQPPAFLNTAPRLKLVAEWLHDSATTGEKVSLKLLDVLKGNWKVYPKDEPALTRMAVADKLAGKQHADWPLKLSLLAIANDRPDIANAAAGRVALDGLPGGSKNEDVLAALAFCMKRAKTPDLLPPSDRAAAYAAAARLALRALEFDFDDCTTTDDTTAREGDRFRLIQSELIADGLALPANAPDKTSLDFSKFRSTPVGANFKASEYAAQFDAFYNRMPAQHPDRADVCAWRAFATMLLFAPYEEFGVAVDPNNPDRRIAAERTREDKWQQIADDARDALKVDPNHGLANRMMAYVIASELGSYLAYPPPASQWKFGQYATNRTSAQNAVEHFAKAAAAMSSRKNNVFWMNRGTYLFHCGNDFAKAGEPAATVKGLLDGALDSVKKADAQRAKQRYEEPRLIACISEDLAWLAQTDPGKNYAAALRYLKTERSATSKNEPLEGLIDQGRCVVRSVHFGQGQKGDLGAAAAILGDERLSAAPGLIPAKALYWTGVLHRVGGDADRADAAWTKAARAFAESGLASDVHAWCHAQRAESAADALDAKRKVDFDAEAAAREAIKALDGLLTGDLKSFYSPSTSFVPDYLRGRLALATGGAAAAAPYFNKAYETLSEAARSKKLRVEDPFAFHCLAHELNRCGKQLTAAERGKRLDLLTDLEARFKWVLNDDDQKLLAEARKNAK